MTSSPLLQGSFGPVADELDVECDTTEGEVPRDLNGIYVRTGPNARHAPKGRYHWFDGDGMLHGLYFEHGKVRYRNRFVRTYGFEEERRAGGPIWPGVMDPPLAEPGRTPLKNTANTDVIFHDGKLLSSWYLSGELYEVDPSTLETLGRADFHGTLRSNVSAHCRSDERTGELLYFDYGKEWPYMRHGIVGADGKVRRAMDVELPAASLPHDMAITRKYVVLHDMSLSFDPEALQAGRHKIRYFSQRMARFAVMAREGANAEVRWFDAEPCFMYHVVNAWDEGDEVVMVGCRFRAPKDRTGAPDEAAFARMIAHLQLNAYLYEWRFNLVTGKTAERIIDDALNSEFPAINTAWQAESSRYSYQLLAKNRELDIPYFSGIAKYDIRTGSFSAHSDGEHCWYNEGAFAPADRSTSEDDGYLVTIVSDRNALTSQAHIYDARGTSVGRGPIARVNLPRRVPNGFHATWVSAQRMAGARESKQGRES